MLETTRNKTKRTAQFLVPVALFLVVGVVQIVSAFYCFNAGNIHHWIGTILIVGTVLDIAIIVFWAVRFRRSGRPSH